MDRKRSVGLLGAISIGVGGMVGGGIFAVLGEAVSLAHGATPLAFLFAGGVALLTSYSYAKLSVAFPSRGGTVVFIDKAFRHNLFSGSVNFMLWLSYLVTIALYAVAFASYAQTFSPLFSSAAWRHVFICTAIFLPAVINLVSATFVSRSETAIVVTKVVLLLVIIASGLPYLDTHRLSPERWGSGLSIVVSGMIIFVAYEGFELIANAAERIERPTVNLPRAFFGSVLSVIVLYVAISIVTVGVVPEATLRVAKDYALAVAAKPALGQAGFTVVAVAALLATFSAINATVFGNARLGYILAKEGELPEELEREARGVPDMGVLATTLIGLLIANFVRLTEIAIIGSASFLLLFAVVNLCAYRLRAAIGGNRWVVLGALVSSVAALVILLGHTYSSNPHAVGIFAGFIGLAVGFELIYGRLFRGHWFHRPYGAMGPEKG